MLRSNVAFYVESSSRVKVYSEGKFEMLVGDLNLFLSLLPFTYLLA